MSNKELVLKDFIRVTADESMRSLDDTQKVFLKDSIGGTNKGLLVTFDLSHSGRKINNRIYPPSGQREGAQSWTHPYRRPIILNHDSKTDPIGRFTEVTWQSLEREAIEHLGDVRAYIEVKKAFDSGDPKRVYTTYNKYNLFNDKEWPGLGKLVAKALITDKDAVEKFLDGRYLTFSAGSRTNAYTCMVCGSGWHAGDICDHRPGIADEDGNTAYFMTGTFLGDEGSVVNMPADSFSQVRNLELQDFVNIQDGEWAFMDADENSLMFTDSKMEVISMSKIELQDLMELEPDTVVDKLVDGSLEFNFEDLSGDNHTEVAWLIRIHDSLHARYDSTIRGEYGEKMENMPAAVFKLHGTIHKGSMEKDFRDAMINGDLDYFNDMGDPSEEYVWKTDSSDSEQESLQQLKDEIMELKKALESNKPEIVTEDKEQEISDENKSEVLDGTESTSDIKDEDLQEKEKEEEQQKVASSVSLEDLKALLEKDPEEIVESLKEMVDNNESDFDMVDDDTIDWFVLDMALNNLVGTDATLSAAQREKLPKSSFCGPDRSFPVPDCAHVTAARRLINRAKLSSDQKDRIMACVERKAKNLSCDATKDSQECKCEGYDSLKEDYAQALKQVDSLKTRLESALEAHAVTLNANISTEDNAARLDSLTSWFDNIENTDVKTEDSKNPLEHIKPVDNPSVASSEGHTPERKLGDFEKNILTRYNKIRDEQGEEMAENWFRAKRKYLSPTFDIAKYTTN